MVWTKRGRHPPAPAGGREQDTVKNVFAGFTIFTDRPFAIGERIQVSDFAMNVLFIYYIRPGADILGTQNSVNLAILDRFNAEGLSFAFPTQTIELAGGAPTS